MIRSNCYQRGWHDKRATEGKQHEARAIGNLIETGYRLHSYSPIVQVAAAAAYRAKPAKSLKLLSMTQTCRSL